MNIEDVIDFINKTNNSCYYKIVEDDDDYPNNIIWNIDREFTEEIKLTKEEKQLKRRFLNNCPNKIYVTKLRDVKRIKKYKMEYYRIE